MKKQKGFSVIEVLLIFIIVGLVAGTGWYVWRSKKNADASLNQAGAGSQETALNSIPDKTNNRPKSIDGTSVNNVVQDESLQEKNIVPGETTHTFHFLDTTGWVERQAPDNSYVVKFDAGKSYGGCKDNSSTLLLGIVVLYLDGNYPCSGIKDAVALLPGPSDMVLTRVAFGKSEELWDKSNASSQKVKLVNGEDAIRYEYTNVIDGRTFYTIEYDTTNNGTSYVAADHWLDNYVNNRYDVYADYFDTVVQKTWEFK